MISDNNGAGADNRRPTAYSEEIGTQICEQLFEGKSLYAICSDPGMPTKATVLSWLTRHHDFRNEYAFAQGLAEDCFMDECVEIADDWRGDKVEKVRRDGTVVTVPDRKNLARCRLRLDVRHWVADQRDRDHPVKFSPDHERHLK